jgi:2-polyprenyl-6-methoxyphenol hydroxylase-like FAD-dependent oxidoreductase
MSNVTVMGGGICGLLSALLLAEDGHSVTVLERDPTPPPANTEEAWDDWERKGVRQFHMGHYFMPRFRIELERELPDVIASLDAAGALRTNLIDNIPVEIRGEEREGDSNYAVITGRRPVMEGAIARTAEAHDRITVRRGCAVTALIVEHDKHGDIDHVAGVVTEAGEEIRSDLLVDASGRQSPMIRLLSAAGSTPPVDEGEDSGFVYYGRTFRNADGTYPFAFGGPINVHDSISILTLVADKGTWFVGIVASGKDRALRAMSDDEVWTQVVKAYPLVAHWLDGEALHSVEVLGNISDRIRRYIVDGKPVVTGVAAISDAWSCTNPSVGRGATVGLLHAIQLRNQMRSDPTVNPVQWALDWAARTEEHIEPWYHDTVVPDRLRRLQIEASVAGEEFVTDDVAWEFRQRATALGTTDPDVLRAVIDAGVMMKRLDEVMADEALVAKVMSADMTDVEPAPGPNREELLAIIDASKAPAAN